MPASNVNRRSFLGQCAGAVCAAGLASAFPAVSEPVPQRLRSPLEWLNTVYEQAAEKNVLAALNPKVRFGYFSVCADGQGFGYGHTYPSLDGHQLSQALLYLGRKAEVLANWDYVKGYQKPNGHTPIMIDAKGDGLYKHWCPGDPLRALAPVTYAHNAHAIYTHTLDRAWLDANLDSINLAMEYLESLCTPEGRVGGAGFYVEVPTRSEWDGVSQCYAVDALDRVVALNAAGGRPDAEARWRALSQKIRGNFLREFWRGNHCVEYIHPEKGVIDRHGLTDVDWAAVAVGMLPEDAEKALWARLKEEKAFRYGGMPTGISTAPETYEDWEFIPAEQFPNNDRRHDLAAMGRVWYLESWARARMGDIQGLLDSMRKVAEVGALNNYSWQERYFPAPELKPGGPMTYCEYPANLVRIFNNLVLGIAPGADGVLRIQPALPTDWRDWKVETHIGDGLLKLSLAGGKLRLEWSSPVDRNLTLALPSGGIWTPTITADTSFEMHSASVSLHAEANKPVSLELAISPIPAEREK